MLFGMFVCVYRVPLRAQAFKALDVTPSLLGPHARLVISFSALSVQC